jgi:hypothetical protein
MSHSLRAVVAVALLGLLAACGAKTEEVTYVDTPVAAEPTFTGKYN